MSLSPTELHHLCRLSRLAPDAESLSHFAEQCSDILAYMDQLAEVDTTNVEPLYSPVAHASAMREDVALRRLDREAILANAPETDGSFFIVPRIVARQETRAETYTGESK